MIRVISSNPFTVMTHLPLLPPMELQSRFGPRIDPIAAKAYAEGRTKKPPAIKVHKGLDVTARDGRIFAVGPGVVTYSGFGRGDFAGYGYVVAIQHVGGLETRYAHMRAPPAVHVGSPVQGGVMLGAIGSTGNSTGPHLHFEVRQHGEPVDPKPFLSQIVGRRR